MHLGDEYQGGRRLFKLKNNTGIRLNGYNLVTKKFKLDIRFLTRRAKFWKELLSKITGMKNLNNIRMKGRAME